MIPLPLALALAYGPIESGAPIVGAPRGVEDLGEMRATTYAPGDGQSGDDVGCPAEAERGPGARAFAALALAGVPVVAHRSLPCGTWLVLCGPGGCALGVVLDRGTYGCRTPDGVRHVAVRVGRRIVTPDDCDWIADIDLVPAVAEAIGLPGAGNQRRGEVRAWRVMP